MPVSMDCRANARTLPRLALARLARGLVWLTASGSVLLFACGGDPGEVEASADGGAAAGDGGLRADGAPVDPASPDAASGDASLTAVCPPYPAIPDASCTGWKHTGVTLKKVGPTSSGPGWHVENVANNDVLYVTEDGAVLDGLDVPFLVKVFANNVTIKRSRIVNGGYYCLFIGDPPKTYSGLHLEDVELDGTKDTASFTIAINASEGARFTRVDVHGMASSGPRLTTGNVVEDSWMHDFAHGPDGHEAGMSSNGSDHGIVVRHNNIDIHTEGASAALALYRDFGNPYDVLVEHNLFNGGNFGMMAGISSSDGAYTPINDIRILNNTFGRANHPQCGSLAAIAQFSSTNGTGNLFTGNVWGGGAAADGTHAIGDPVIP